MDEITSEVGAAGGLVAHFADESERGASLTFYELDEDEIELLIFKNTRKGIRLDVLVNDGDVDFSDAVVGLLAEWEYDEAEGDMATDLGSYLTYYLDETPADLAELCVDLLMDVYRYGDREEVGVEADGYILP